MSSLVLLTVFTLYLLTLVIIGWFSFRRGVGSAEDYFMAEIAKKLKSNPGLWDIPRNNITKWKKGRGKLAPALIEWDHILNTTTKEQILSILESSSEESVRLRSSFYRNIDRE